MEDEIPLAVSKGILGMLLFSQRSDLMILVVVSNLNESMIIRYMELSIWEFKKQYGKKDHWNFLYNEFSLYLSDYGLFSLVDLE